MISGFVRPEAGSIALGTRQIGAAELFERASLADRETFQTPILVDDMTIYENVTVASEQREAVSTVAWAFGLPGTWRKRRHAGERARDCIELAGLGISPMRWG